MIITLRDEVEKTAVNVAKTLIKHHRLIYGVGPDQRLDPVGSGLLLRVGSSHFLVTAAHVLDENTQSPDSFCDLVTYGQRLPVILQGASFRTTIAEGKTREDDPLDVGFIELPDAQVAQLGVDRFLEPSQIDLNDKGDSPALYGAFGYPASLNYSIEPDWESPVNPTPFSYTSQLRSSAAHVELGVSQATHLVLAASNRKTRAPGGRKVKLPDLRGMSGGGFWRYTEYGQANPVKAPCLLGVLIERRRCKDGGILAARMNLVFEALRKAYPALDPFLPRSEIADITVTMV